MHMLVWVHGAPSIYNRTELQIGQLIDNKVGCIVAEDDVSIPSSEAQPLNSMYESR